MKKGLSTLKALVFGLIAVFCFIACHLFNSPTTPLTKQTDKGSQIRLNSKHSPEIPANSNEIKVNISPSHLLANAHITIAQEVFLIFEISFEGETSIEDINFVHLPFNKFLCILLREIISPNAP